jgi:hypothetical protein
VPASRPCLHANAQFLPQFNPYELPETALCLMEHESTAAGLPRPIPERPQKGRAPREEPPMNTNAISAPTIPSGPAWRSLLWTVPFTVLWTWLIYRLPALLDSGLPAMTARLMVHGLIALGLWLGLESTDLTPGQRT